MFYPYEKISKNCNESFQTLESEGPAVVEDRRPPDNWPRTGSIRFSNVKMRYRPNLPLVLKGISFDIEPQEKIGNRTNFI